MGRYSRLSVSTFNIWCPLFRRVGPDAVPEARFRDIYMQRMEAIIDHLLKTDSDIVCLQEFWVSNKELVELFRERLSGRYQWFQLDRTHERGDGIVTLLRHGIVVCEKRDIIFRDLGDRVAMMLRVLLLPPTPDDERAEFLLVNTHLIFPHQPNFSVIRMRELRKILGFLELYRRSHKSYAGTEFPIVLCGDFNGSPRGMQYKFLMQRNFSSSEHDEVCVTHRNHLGERLCCDYVFAQNPQDSFGPLEDNLLDIVFRSTSQRVATLQRVPSVNSLAQAAKAPLQARERVCNASAYRHALMFHGFESVARNLTDSDISNLMEGPDSRHVDDDILINSTEAFAIFDRNHSGGIDLLEFETMCADLRLGMTPSEIRRAFEKLDANRSGSIEIDEFSRWWVEEMNRVRGTQYIAKPDGTWYRSKSDLVLEVNRTRAAPCHSEPHEDPRRRQQCVKLNRVWSTVYPPKLELGEWDPDFSLSDHGMVTSYFEVVRPPKFSSDVEYRAAVDYLSERSDTPLPPDLPLAASPARRLQPGLVHASGGGVLEEGFERLPSSGCVRF